jgi:hypothetical protein
MPFESQIFWFVLYYYANCKKNVINLSKQMRNIQYIIMLDVNDKCWDIILNTVLKTNSLSMHHNHKFLSF